MADLGALLRARAAETPHATAVVCGPGITYAELDARADAWAGRLRRYGAGARVATLCLAGIEQIALLHGCARGGTVLTPLSYRLRPAELAYLIDDAEPAVLLYDPAFAALARDSVRRAGCEVVLLPMAAPQPAPARDLPVDPEATVLLVYTSGSSGRPRGVPLSQRMCIGTDDALDGIARLSADDVVLQVLPQYHVGGWTVLPLLALARGARLVVESGFDPVAVLRRIEAERATVTMGVPAMYRMMADAGVPAELGTLRLAIAGGSALPEQLARRWWALGVPLCQGYGLTEAGPNVLGVPPSRAAESAGSCGPPYPGVGVTLADDGELLVRGDGVFTGYWRRTDPPLVDGWLHTGDVAERDERGWYRIVGRLDDMYVSGGENIAPAEVERVLLAHPAVRDAAVVGVPDERWGAVGVAFVTLRSEVDGEGIRLYCREHLAGFKVPARIVVVDRLPEAGLGKVRRGALRSMAGATT